MGGMGGDNFQGGNGTTLSYEHAASGMNADLVAGTTSHGNFLDIDYFSNIQKVIGSKYDDTIYAANNTVITGGMGNDIIDATGKTGVTAVFSGNSYEYTITAGMGGSWVVSGNTADGTDTLTNVAKLQFSDQVVLVGANPLPSLPTFGGGFGGI